MSEKEIDIRLTERALVCKEACADTLFGYLQFDIPDELRKTMEFDLKMHNSRIEFYKRKINNFHKEFGTDIALNNRNYEEL